MDFTLLGEVTARHDGQLLPLGGQQRAVLAVLLFQPRIVVSRTKIVELAWGPQPGDAPRTAEALVTDYVSRLRAVFRNAAGGTQLTAREPGYLIDVPDDAVDWHRFRALVDQAQAARDADEWDAAAESLVSGLALWQGPALAGLGAALDPLRRPMEERRLVAAEMYATVELARGQPDRAAAALADLVRQYPIREQLAALLVRALGAAGRRDEAVAVYQHSRGELRKELGLEPTPVLQEAFRTVLAGPPSTGLSVPRSVGLAQLPLDTPNFTGRTAELATVLALVPAAAPAGEPAAATGTGPICVLEGMPGVGKTALAVHAAHRLASHFPDGQLFLDLHGHTKGSARVVPAEALDRLLRALGVPGTKIPHHLDDCAALYRDRLAGRRILVLLDNAYSAEQVRPLLPAAPGCLVLVTSRNRLTALDDALPLTLATLPTADAVTLFGRVAGVDRVSGQNEAVERIADLCGGLPLAVRIVAAPLRTHSTRRPASVADELADAHDQLSELTDGERSIAAAFQLSYEDLSPEQRRTFRLLGVVPGRDVDAYAAAALLDAPVGRATRLLRELLDTHLLDQHVDGRHHFHELMRSYAATQAAEHESVLDRQAALARLLDYQLQTAAAAMDVLFPHERDRRPSISASGTPRPPVSDPVLARAWLDAERVNLIAAAAHAAENGWPAHTWRLGAVLHRYLTTGAHYADALDLHGNALRAARDRHDRAAEGTVLDHLGDTYRHLGRYQEALHRFREALAARREVGDRTGEAISLSNIGIVLGVHGRFQDAVDRLQHALGLSRQVGSRANEANILACIGNVHLFTGEYDDALRRYQEALHIYADIGDRAGQATALNNLGDAHKQRGRYGLAFRYYQRAARIFAEVGNRAGEGLALTNVGEMHERRQRFQSALRCHLHALQLLRGIGYLPGEGEALSHVGSTYAALGQLVESERQFQRALAVARQMGDRTLETIVLNGLGLTLRASGRSTAALESHRAALELASGRGNRREEGHAREGIAEFFQAAGELASAQRQWRAALEIYDELNVPEADQLRTRLRQFDFSD